MLFLYTLIQSKQTNLINIFQEDQRKAFQQ